MVKITYVLPDGSRREIDAPEGRSVMETAIANGIDGIVAECGGSLACATCHCFVDDATAARLGAPGETENEMLDFAAVPRQDTSRLSCQVMIEQGAEGMVVTIPETQV